MYLQKYYLIFVGMLVIYGFVIYFTIPETANLTRESPRTSLTWVVVLTVYILHHTSQTEFCLAGWILARHQDRRPAEGEVYSRQRSEGVV